MAFLSNGFFSAKSSTDERGTVAGGIFADRQASTKRDEKLGNFRMHIDFQ